MKSESAGPGPAAQKAAITVVMGVSGSGKTLIGVALATAIGGRFVEGDDYHPKANIDRMAGGLPLRDEDRWGWLDAIAGEIAEAARSGGTLVIACSALKRVYRDRLRSAYPPIRFIYLEISPGAAAARVATRGGHFMPSSLVESQFATLEPPSPDEGALRLDAAGDARSLVNLAAAALSVIRDAAPMDAGERHL